MMDTMTGVITCGNKCMNSRTCAMQCKTNNAKILIWFNFFFFFNLICLDTQAPCKDTPEYGLHCSAGWNNTHKHNTLFSKQAKFSYATGFVNARCELTEMTRQLTQNTSRQMTPSWMQQIPILGLVPHLSVMRRQSSSLEIHTAWSLLIVLWLNMLSLKRLSETQSKEKFVYSQTSCIHTSHANIWLITWSHSRHVAN